MHNRTLVTNLTRVFYWVKIIFVLYLYIIYILIKFDTVINVH